MLQQEILPPPIQLKKEFSTEEEDKNFIESSRDAILSILNGEDARTLLIVGPCSIHDKDACLKYAKRLKALAENVASSFFIVMRAYYEKPRSLQGWKGLLYDPHLDESHRIPDGLKTVRHFLLQLAKLKIPAATEFLDPFCAPYFSDLISWGCIGARTTESQTHRQLASSLNLPISFKNSTTGNIEVAINGILNAALPQSFMGLNEEGVASLVRSSGNSDCHLTLRGSDFGLNYDPESISKSLEALEKCGLKKRLIIDCSHGNSGKDLTMQYQAFQSVLQQIAKGNTAIKGLILESHLFSGNQTFAKDAKLEYGVSITDPCLSFEATEELIYQAFEQLQKKEELTTCRI